MFFIKPTAKTWITNDKEKQQNLTFQKLGILSEIELKLLISYPNRFFMDQLINSLSNCCRSSPGGMKLNADCESGFIAQYWWLI